MHYNKYNAFGDCQILKCDLNIDTIMIPSLLVRASLFLLEIILKMLLTLRHNRLFWAFLRRF